MDKSNQESTLLDSLELQLDSLLQKKTGGISKYRRFGTGDRP